MFIHTTSAAYYGRSIKITSDILELEKHKSLEINSRWYELIADLASQKSCEQEWCHTIYILENMKIDELDWNQYSMENNHHNYFDCVLAAHIVYDPSMIENLVKTIRILLQKNQQCSAYIANAIRNESTYEQLI
ncbi:unnamed protein product [Adineta steineri]|uniref:Uncharacterized protein n=1 Tax=Adineta steineri TaxID=433720 RepID=A0A819TR25_9BILA|nr:unnamed protein product [Adineta steineri]